MTTLVQLEMKNALVKAKLAEDPTLTEFGDHADNVALTTAVTSSTFAAVSGNSTSSTPPPTETIVLNIAQSLVTGSMWLFLRNNHGKKGQVEISPTGAATPKITADVTFQAPGVLGGAVGAGTSGAVILVDGLADITPAAA